MVIGTGLHWQNTPTIIASIVLAFIFGYLLTIRSLRKARMPVRESIRLALASDTTSIAIMEIVDTGVMLAWPGAMDAGIAQPLFWFSLLISLVAAGVVAYPVNRWLILRGRGHALIHHQH